MGNCGGSGEIYSSGSYNTARSCTVSELYRGVQRLRKYSAYPFMSFVWLWVLRIPMLLAVGRMYTDNPGAIWIVMGISNVLAAAAGHLLYRHIYVKNGVRRGVFTF